MDKMLRVTLDVRGWGQMLRGARAARSRSLRWVVEQARQAGAADLTESRLAVYERSLLLPPLEHLRAIASALEQVSLVEAIDVLLAQQATDAATGAGQP